MNILAKNNAGVFVELEELPSFCHIREDLIDQNTSIPVGDGYLEPSNKIYLYACDAVKDYFYIFINGIAQEANSMDFNFCVDQDYLEEMEVSL